MLSTLIFGPNPNYTWVALVYILTLALGQLLVGRLSDLFGRRGSLSVDQLCHSSAVLSAPLLRLFLFLLGLQHYSDSQQPLSFHIPLSWEKSF